MALDSKSIRVAATQGNRLDGLRMVLASALPEADLSDIDAASEYMDEVLSGRLPSPGWQRCIFPGWQDTRDGIRLAQRAIRVGLHRHQLPATGEVFDLVCAFAHQSY